MRRFDLGSVLNGGGSFPGDDKHASPEDWLALADDFHEASTDTSDGGVGIPAIWGVDAVHGHNNVIGATIFPHNIGLGAARNPDLIRRIGEITAREVRATGLDWNFGPTIAVARDDRWGRTYESYSEDPEIVTLYARALVEGLQGTVGSPEFLGEERVIATAKHFLGDGGTFEGLDQGDTRASEEELRDLHGAPYVAALDAGAQAVMSSFSSWHGLKLHGHAGLLTDVLKGRMAFDGLVVGDWNGHGQLPGCSNESCADTIRAGLDLFMVPEDWRALHRNTLRQARSGAIPEARLDDAVRRILRVKIRAGLLDSGRPSERALGGQFDLLGAPEHRDVARQAVRESLVLLKNDDGPPAPLAEVARAGSGAGCRRHRPAERRLDADLAGHGQHERRLPGRHVHLGRHRTDHRGGGRPGRPLPGLRLQRRAAGRRHLRDRRDALRRRPGRRDEPRVQPRRQVRRRADGPAPGGRHSGRHDLPVRTPAVGEPGDQRIGRLRRRLAARLRGRRRGRRPLQPGRRRNRPRFPGQALLLLAALAGPDGPQRRRRGVRPALPLRLRPDLRRRGQPPRTGRDTA